MNDPTLTPFLTLYLPENKALHHPGKAHSLSTASIDTLKNYAFKGNRHH